MVQWNEHYWFPLLVMELGIKWWTSGVTESLFLWGGGGKRVPDLLGVGGPRGQHCNDFFPITFIVHNQKSNLGANGGGGYGVNGGTMAPQAPPPPPHSYAIVLNTKGSFIIKCCCDILVDARDVMNKCNTYHEYEVTKEGRKCFYLTTLSTHFYLWLYGIRHKAKDHSDSERGNPLPPHGLLFPVNSKGSFICTIAQTG